MAYFSAIFYREALDRLCVRLNMYLVIYIFNVATIIGELKMNILNVTGSYYYVCVQPRPVQRGRSWRRVRAVFQAGISQGTR